MITMVDLYIVACVSLILLAPIAAQVCTAELQATCYSCFDNFCVDKPTGYNCTLPGLESFTPGQYEGITANYLSYATSISTPNFPLRAKEFQACTGGEIVFSDAVNVFEDPMKDLGTRTARGFEFYDGYFMSASHFPEASALDLFEHLNDRLRADNAILKWEDMLPKVRQMGEYRKDGKTNLDFLMFDGDFFVPIIRLDLLERHNLTLPNTWEEVVEYAKYFNNTDLNDDGEPDYGFCHFPREGAGYWDWWASEAMYSIWATYDQTLGSQEGFFFDQDTLNPQTSNGFKKAAKIWKELWLHGATADSTISPNYISGRCAIGFGPPGGWKRIFLDPDGVSRKDESGNVVWRPTLKSGEYAEPYRFKPFGTTQVYDRSTGEVKDCTPELCPTAELIPAKGHMTDYDRASILPPSPLAGKLVNRAPFYWSGGLGTGIRKSAPVIKKDLLWDFFVYTNCPATSVYDVANYASWLDSWRYSQLQPGDNFLEAGWSRAAYEEHSFVMQWALSSEVNGALNIRIPGSAEYTRDCVGDIMREYIKASVSLDEFSEFVTACWEVVTLQHGKLNQLDIYRSSLGLDTHTEVELCRLHRDLVDRKDPSICRKFDAAKESVVPQATIIILSIVIPLTILIIGIIVFVRRWLYTDSLWEINPDELRFVEPPEVLGRGTHGLVVLAEYRGTEVAVKRVIAPKLTANENRSPLFGNGDMTYETDRASLLRTAPHDRSSSRSFTSSSTQTRRQAEFYDLIGLDVESNFVDRSHMQRRSSVMSPRSEPKATSRLYSSSIVVNGGSGAYDASAFSSLVAYRRGRWLGTIGGVDEYSIMKTNFVAEMRRLAKLRHPSITTVMGAVVTNKCEPMLVMEYMDHGSLYDVLHNNTIPLEGDLLLPILRDIAQGLRFLHSAAPQIIHGDLKAQNVLVDCRFRAKVTDFGLPPHQNGATGTPLWMAPELLRGESSNSAPSDVYSFGILINEVYSRSDPYVGEDPRRVLKEVANVNIQKRPIVPFACPPKVVSIMTDCMVDNPTVRPSFQEIDLRLKRMDTEHADPLSESSPPRVTKKTNAKRNEDLLLRVFPKHIAEALRDGRNVDPEKKDEVTIFFCDVVGYTHICGALTAEKASDMLDRLYTKFDALCSTHGIFKMETIGDAYMGVTNLVEDQRSDHVMRIAIFALDAIQAASETLVDTENPGMGYVRIRAGFHSGPVIARVVGTRNPKYGIFGDTVNTAARMESTSMLLQVQCSKLSASLLAAQGNGDTVDTAALLERSSLKVQCSNLSSSLLATQGNDTVILYPRGNIKVKGKGEMETFFVAWGGDSSDETLYSLNPIAEN